MDIRIFTDGGAFRNPKTESGFDSVAAYNIWIDNEEVVCTADFLKGKTNNFAEMYSIYKSLKIVYEYLSKHVNDIEDVNIKVITDSELCKKSLTEWMNGWLQNESLGVLYNSKKEPVANQQLILMATIYLERLKVMCNDQLYVQHINSHNSKSTLNKDCAKFNKKNNENLTIDEYAFYFVCNDKCDKLVKQIYEEACRLWV